MKELGLNLRVKEASVLNRKNHKKDGDAASSQEPHKRRKIWDEIARAWLSQPRVETTTPLLAPEGKSNAGEPNSLLVDHLLAKIARLEERVQEQQLEIDTHRHESKKTRQKLNRYTIIAGVLEASCSKEDYEKAVAVADRIENP